MTAPAPPSARSFLRLGRGVQLTDRDLEILRMTALNGAVTVELIAHVLFARPGGAVGYRAAYQRIHTLKEAGLLRSDKAFAHRPAAISVTPQGARLADVGVGPADVPDTQLEHTLQLAWLNVWNARAIPGVEVTYERQLYVERAQDEDDGLRSGSRPRCPDARYLIPGQGRDGKPLSVAVELDLSRKDRRTVERLIYSYDRALDIDQVWWYVRPGGVDRMLDIVRSLHAESRIIVKPIPPFPVRPRSSPRPSLAPSSIIDQGPPPPLRGPVRRFGAKRLRLPAVARPIRSAGSPRTLPGPSIT